ncbi:MAG: autoinducer binding domain-containing protein [Rhizobiaceae bacterium]
MFNVKVFSEFSASRITRKEDRQFLKEIIAVKKQTTANYVNFSIFDYQKEDPYSRHFLTYPNRWISFYVENCCADHDPLLKIDYRKASVIDWDELTRDDNYAVISTQLQRFGLGNKGITVCTHGGEKRYGALSMIFQYEPKSWTRLRDKHLDQFKTAASRICRRYLDIYESSCLTAASLTPREREVLHLVALGRTDEQVAKDIGIGKWTVVSHMQSAKYKLNCSNRAAAVAKAVTLGLINIKRAV